MAKFCINCGAELKEGADVCVGCGKVINKEETKASAGNKSKVTAGLLALFLGTLGIHNFYLGHTGKAVAQLVITIIGWITLVFIVGTFLIGAVSIWAFIEMIMIFTGGIKDSKGNSLI